MSHSLYFMYVAQWQDCASCYTNPQSEFWPSYNNMWFIHGTKHCKENPLSLINHSRITSANRNIWAGSIACSDSCGMTLRDNDKIDLNKLNQAPKLAKRIVCTSIQVTTYNGILYKWDTRHSNNTSPKASPEIGMACGNSIAKQIEN